LEKSEHSDEYVEDAGDDDRRTAGSSVGAREEAGDDAGDDDNDGGSDADADGDGNATCIDRSSSIIIKPSSSSSDDGFDGDDSGAGVTDNRMLSRMLAAWCAASSESICIGSGDDEGDVIVERVVVAVESLSRRESSDISE